MHDREILCRDYCKLPSTGYYNLNGQAVGIDDINSAYCNTSRWWLIGLELICLVLVYSFMLVCIKIIKRTKDAFLEVLNAANKLSTIGIRESGEFLKKLPFEEA